MDQAPQSLPVFDMMVALPVAGFWTVRAGTEQRAPLSAMAAVSPYFDLVALLGPGNDAGQPADPARPTYGAAAPAAAFSAFAPGRNVNLFGARPIRFGAIPTGKRLALEIRRAASLDRGMLCGSGRCPAEVREFADRIPPAGSGVERLAAEVNRQVNARITYAEDRKTHAMTDHWSLPAETIASGMGDCEDFAVLKMGLMAERGIPMADMAVVVVKDTRRRLYHAVLAVSMDGGTLILDNMRDENRHDTDLPDYAPLFAVGGSGNYIFGYTPAQKIEMASTGNLGQVAPGAGF
ncbi:transglutaminase-like cysteine peptidase [Hoeflea marina]|uniref:transglutaminase-like cysteine peptidase n=1 Tax=Hoeflea marina TaxID=274592 RepID=UPI001304A4CD|nr:transglutaminase-like cysteine peptidase [Hoeflea marina]